MPTFVKPLIKFDSKVRKIILAQPFSLSRISISFIALMNKTFGHTKFAVTRYGNLNLKLCHKK